MTSRCLPSSRTWRSCSPVWKSGQTGCSAIQTPGTLHPHPWSCPHSESACSFLQHCQPRPTCVPAAPSQLSSLFPLTHSLLFLSTFHIWTLVFPFLEHRTCPLMFLGYFFLFFWSIPSLLVFSFHSLLCFVLFPCSCSLIHFILFMFTISAADLSLGMYQCLCERLFVSLPSIKPCSLSLCTFQAACAVLCTLSPCLPLTTL